jgi:hypothetical protein
VQLVLYPVQNGLLWGRIALVYDCSVRERSGSGRVDAGEAVAEGEGEVMSLYRRARRRQRVVDGLIFALALLLVIALIGACWWLIIWRGEAVIIVEDRWWVSNTRVLYNTTDIDTSMDEDGNVTVSTSTSTHTRCKSELVGRELPVTYPPEGCKVRRGDYIRTGQNFYILYHEQETQESTSRSFSPNLWDYLAPGNEVKVSWSVMRYIVEAEYAANR